MSVLAPGAAPPEPSSPVPSGPRPMEAEVPGPPGYRAASHSAPERPPAPRLPSIAAPRSVFLSHPHPLPCRSSSSPGLSPAPPAAEASLPPLAAASPSTPGEPGEPGEAGLPKRITLPPISENTRQSLSNGTGAAPPAAASPPNAAAATEEPLPPGWEMRYDQYGRRYYVDHNTRWGTFREEC
jgi:hypothetical protein